jgi:DNA polymerase I-like protein with 3'-5' exonuclease and polymerase domains
MAESTEAAEAPPKRKSQPRTVFLTPEGAVIDYSGAKLKKFFRDLIRYHLGAELEGKKLVVKVSDPNAPLGGYPLLPGPQSPICTACGLDQAGARHPYLRYLGPDQPLATIIVENISRKEDERGQLGAGGRTAHLAGRIYQLLKEHGVPLNQIRWVPVTRCASWEPTPPNYRTKGNWCRYYLIQDLLRHPPRVVIPVGTAVLGLLSHKSNAQDWSGRLLTWRGWPDDWLTEPAFMLSRPDPAHPGATVCGHPIFGPPPNIRIPMVPVQDPYRVLATKNRTLAEDWEWDFLNALNVGKNGVKVRDYGRPWYRLSTDAADIRATLERVIRFAREHAPFPVAYDTETTGLKAWSYIERSVYVDNREEVTCSPAPRIVFMMFRWTDPDTGQPDAIGFPWDFPESELAAQREALQGVILELLSTAEIIGHNLTFDELFTIATVGAVPGEHDPFGPDGAWNPTWLALQGRINRLCEAMGADTWHMVFTLLQKRGSLGLEVLAYDWAPDLAGYEEEFTLLLRLYGDTMDPANEKGGHYANCPRDLWESHLKPYVMGDVEATYQVREVVAQRLEHTRVYKIPLARPDKPGYFRDYTCHNRAWVYRNIVLPASRTLTKMMARGMYVDAKELQLLEDLYPDRVAEKKAALRQVDPEIERWCLEQAQRAQLKADAPPWELDLENRGQLKALLFQQLKLEPQRFTKAGRKLYGDDPEKWKKLPREEQELYAALDRYTLNKLAVDHPNVRPLQEYRKVYKLYTTYIRPMRNMTASRLDKKKRDKPPNLSVDHCIHSQFMLTGTLSGRLSSRDPNLQQLPNDADIKRLFVSRFGVRGCIYAADLSQIELRLMATACGDPSMVDAYWQDIDLHSLTASKIAWSDGRHAYEEFTKKHMEDLQRQGKTDLAKKLDLKRKIAKTVNFLTGYGGGAFGLQNVLANNQVYLSLEECERIIESFFDAYPALKRFLGVYKDFIERHAVAVSIFGRVRHFEEIRGEDQEARNKALRAGCNHLIQSTASDMMLICLIIVEAMMREAGLNSLLVSTVHDSLVVDALREELPQVHEIVHGVMNNIPQVLQATLPDFDLSWLMVPLAGDSSCGLNYLEQMNIGSDKNPDWDKLLQPFAKTA